MSDKSRTGAIVMFSMGISLVNGHKLVITEALILLFFFNYFYFFRGGVAHEFINEKAHSYMHKILNLEAGIYCWVEKSS